MTSFNFVYITQVSILSTCLFFGLRAGVYLWRFGVQAARSQDLLRHRSGYIQLLELRDCLRAGVLPSDSIFNESLNSDVDSGFKMARTVLNSMRTRGASILPTLEQLIQSLEYEQEAQRVSQQKSAPARSQAILLSVLIFFFGVGLYGLVPELSQESGIWVCVVALAQILSLYGSFWIFRQADQATRAGLSISDWNDHQLFRLWLNALEALIASGTSPDRAWSEAMLLAGETGQNRLRFLLPDHPWFQAFSPKLSDRFKSTVQGLSQSIQVSLMEGRPCLERIQTQNKDYRARMQASVLRELELLQTRTLKPLFLTLFPAMMFLMAGMMVIILGQEQWM